MICQLSKTKVIFLLDDVSQDPMTLHGRTCIGSTVWMSALSCGHRHRSCGLCLLFLMLTRSMCSISYVSSSLLQHIPTYQLRWPGLSSQMTIHSSLTMTSTSLSLSRCEVDCPVSFSVSCRWNAFTMSSSLGKSGRVSISSSLDRSRVRLTFISVSVIWLTL